ncbi:MAG TPA: hypothetical protein VMW50_03545 [Dehalococcoidia bacterium]|nr:hypothetical protein [Dehalococcoidia bacterium]
MIVYEVVEEGFNGGTDATDEKIIWIISKDKESVIRFCNSKDIIYTSIEVTSISIDSIGIDYVIIGGNFYEKI